MEGGECCVATATGMSAILATCMGLLNAGDHIVAARDLFGSTIILFNNILARFGLSFSYVDATDLQQWRNAITPKTRMLFVESPSNPLCSVADISAIAAIAREHDAAVLAVAGLDRLGLRDLEGPVPEDGLHRNNGETGGDGGEEEEVVHHGREPETAQLVAAHEKERPQRRLVPVGEGDAGNNQRQDDGLVLRNVLEEKDGAVEQDAPGDLEGNRRRLPHVNDVMDSGRRPDGDEETHHHHQVPDEGRQHRRLGDSEVQELV